MEGLLTEFTDSIRIFRTDRITTKGCGNKQFKLTCNLAQLKCDGARRVLSFGGIWSNHLHALAIACEAQGLLAVAVVRGEPVGNSVLLDNAIAHGLKVHYVSRSDYRKRHNADYINDLMHRLSCDAWLPEGGSNDLAVRSCKEIATLVNECGEQPPTCMALAAGTGATLAGVINGALACQKVIGVPVVQDDRLQSSIQNWTRNQSHADWALLASAEPPRYGKVDRSLLSFVLETFDDTGVILDPVYNAKALRSVLAHRAKVPVDGQCVFIHTGGLGGCLGFEAELMAIDPHVAARLLAEVSRLLGLSV